MRCIVCHNKVYKEEELCHTCKRYFKKYPTEEREKILDYYRNLINNEGGFENEESFN